MKVVTMKTKTAERDLIDLVKRWRKEANDLSRLNRFGRYSDQSVRVRQHMVLTTLRRCANALQRQLRRENHHDH